MQKDSKNLGNKNQTENSYRLLCVYPTYGGLPVFLFNTPIGLNKFINIISAF